MAAPADDLPWPELGNVSRGATRGNQGQKGVLGAPDSQGRCLLQLRVQPGVLAVRLNRKSSDWYRTLDAEVNRALKLTKTYWRKARRRQDYDARADQDHMELHEWLQQLKDKTMSHLEVLMQKGDIQGPPYHMPDDLELTFLRKFIDRQAAGIPHNPRLRHGGSPYSMPAPPPVGDPPSPEGSDGAFSAPRMPYDHGSESGSGAAPPSSRTSVSPTLRPDSLSAEASSSKQALQAARAALARAQKETGDAFLRYTQALELERHARQEVVNAEKRRDEVMGMMLARNPLHAETGSRHSSEDRDDSMPHRFTPEDMNPPPLRSWAEVNPESLYGTPGHVTPAFDDDPEKVSRKHPRSWEQGPQLQDTYACDDLGMPPRKRIQPMLPFDPPFPSTLPPSLSIP